MSNKAAKRLLVASILFSIGSAVAITEFFITRTIDSFLPNSIRVKNFRREGTITLLSMNGQIIQKIGHSSRDQVDKEKINKLIKNAFIAAEDRRFYLHNGVDLWGISRATRRNISQASFEEGGSTITQQLARIIFLSQNKSLTRKIKEAAIALKIERDLSKQEILSAYLNNVYLGSGAYGISDAAWIYFSKHINDLNIPEAALIAGLAPAPSLYSPLVNKDLAIQRRNIVLKRMKKEKFISKNEFIQSINSQINLRPSPPRYFNSAAPFFSSWLFQELRTILTPEQIKRGGLTIKTSLNLKWQSIARETIQRFSPEETEAAIVSIESNSGLVRALVGGKNFKYNQFNRATQALRSPGSTFKVFIYAAALLEGFKPEDIFIDYPKCWQGYCPKNFGDKYFGKITLIDAIKTSSNIIAVEILDQVGFEKVNSIANQFGIGIERKLGNYYPLAIGALEETVLNMTAAYSALNNQGIYRKPMPFEEIKGPDNNIIWSLKDNSKERKILNKNTAKTLVRILEESVKDGTGIAASLPNRSVAGKTGTSEGNRDLWFIGSLPELTTGVWFGKDNNEPTNSSSGNAALTWRIFTKEIIKNK